MLSFGKILLIVLVVVVLLVGFRLVGVMKNVSARERPPNLKRRPEPAGPAARSGDLISCPTCGTYTDGPCERPDCPVRRP